MNQSTHPDGRVTKIKTGIGGFDEISSGGLPAGRATLLAGTAGSAKTIFSLEVLLRGIEEFGENGVFVTFEETPRDICENVRSMGWDLDRHVADGRLAFVDASPDSENDTLEIGVYDFSPLLIRIENAVKKAKAKRVAIDSVSALFTQFGDPTLIRRELFRIASHLKRMKVTSLITAERLHEYGEISRYGVEEFVTDNAIILRNVLEQEKRRRTIEILKYRGTVHQKGEYPFTVSSEGIEILPLSSMKLCQRSSDVRTRSGNADLDQMCGGGGVFRDSIVLLSGATGTGKTLLVTTFVNAGCKLGERSLVFAFEESADQLARNAAGWGMDMHAMEKAGLLRVISLYPEAMNLEDHLLAMRKEIESFKPTRIAVDSLSAMERVSSVKSFREFVIGLTSLIKSKEIAGMCTATTASLVGGTSITESHISTITDTIILLRYVELLGEMRRGLTVLKMRGSDHDKSIREYKIDDNGLHISKAFREVNGILTGSPTPFVTADERLNEAFDDVQLGPGAIAGV